ncbi:hypothetical protein [Chryseobacterium sp.]|uniref:hypothetical protein n=1 Tax=Chryseobacterium sp. TaxID=1871047 RepID=UPI00289CA186|nr:hypothetical protein [Chryseobacterium sp.]
MAYTVISVFPPTVDTEEIKSQLTTNGFSDDNIIVSKSKISEESSENFEEDENTNHFWAHMFAHDAEMLDAYSKKSRGNTTIVLYTNSYDEAQKAKALLNEKGAIEVIKQSERGEIKKESTSIPEDVKNGIIAKARHNLYFLGGERTYSPNSQGMGDTMDGLGSKD